MNFLNYYYEVKSTLNSRDFAYMAFLSRDKIAI